MTLLRPAEWPRWLRDFLPLVVWMGLLFWLSSRSRLIEVEGEAQEKLLYKTGHMVAYAGLAWLWWRVLAPGRRFNWLLLGLAWLLTTLYGVTDEIHQLFVPGRHGRLADVLFDAGGALAMVLLIRRIKWLRTFPEEIGES